MDAPDSTLRDQLAVQRTRLANERTLLAYLRTAIMLAATGVTVLTLYQGLLYWSAGGLLLLLALLASVVGVRRFRRVSRLIG